MATKEAVRPEGDVAAFAVTVMSLIDLPFSLVADTICLPYDLANLGRSSEILWYADSNYRTVKTDKTGKLHGKCRFQLHTTDSIWHGNTVWGFATYKHGVLHGRTEAWGRPIGRQHIQGEFREGAPWSGAILIGASDTNILSVGPINQYEDGKLVGTSNIGINLREKGPNNEIQSAYKVTARTRPLCG